MVSLLSATPWGLQGEASEAIDLAIVREETKISGACCPRLIASYEVSPRFGGKRKTLPSISFPFRWDGQILSSFQLPTNSKPNQSLHDYSTKISLDDTSVEIVQSDIVGRPSKKHENEFGRNVQGFIDWQIHSFRELSDNSFLFDEVEDIAQSLVRRNWSTVRRVWIGKKSDEALMALIVKLAQDKDLLRVLETVAENPKYILFRKRQNTSIGRIQELDSACIRDFAKRPGRSMYEKAGARQELLAVQRLESRDTLENRVFTWVINGMLDRAWSYIATNRHHKQSSRVELMARCNRRWSEWISKESLKEVTSNHLQHPVQPNYTLQMDSRYSKVYKAYKLLIREQRVVDDAWQWQRNLWAESARQLMSCAMTEFFKEDYISSPYYRLEGDNGIWTDTPVAPGPFDTKRGKCYVIDSRDAHENAALWVDNPPFEFAPYIGTVGCDQVLYWPETKTLIIVWFVYWTGPVEWIPSMIESSGKALRNLVSDLHRFTRIPYNCFGLLLTTENQGEVTIPGIEVVTWPQRAESEIVALQIPFNIDQVPSQEFEKLIEDFKAGIQLAVEMAY